MAAFAAVLLELGWRPGQGWPQAGALAVASGTAFVAIVAGQSAVALACRSSSRSFLHIPVRDNPFVPIALLITWTLVAGLLYVPWLARPLGHAPPTGRGWLLAAMAFPIVLCVDSGLKAWLRFRRST